MKLQPIGSNVLIRPIMEGSLSKGGLLLPQTAKSKLPYAYGDVIAVGDGATNAQGITKPCSVKPGDVVAYARNAGLELPLEDEKGESVYRLMTDNYILGIVSELPRDTNITSLDGRLMMMMPQSRARDDRAYENIEKLDIATREGWIDINADGTHDHVDEPADGTD